MYFVIAALKSPGRFETLASFLCPFETGIAKFQRWLAFCVYVGIDFSRVKGPPNISLLMGQ